MRRSLINHDLLRFDTRNISIVRMKMAVIIIIVFIISSSIIIIIIITIIGIVAVGGEN